MQAAERARSQVRRFLPKDCARAWGPQPGKGLTFGRVAGRSYSLAFVLLPLLIALRLASHTFSPSKMLPNVYISLPHRATFLARVLTLKPSGPCT